MRVVLNGVDRELPEGAVVVAAVEATGAAAIGRGVAVAVEGQVVPHGEWRRTELSEGQRVEVLQAVQGG